MSTYDLRNVGSGGKRKWLSNENISGGGSGRPAGGKSIKEGIGGIKSELTELKSFITRKNLSEKAPSENIENAINDENDSENPNASNTGIKSKSFKDGISEAKSEWAEIKSKIAKKPKPFPEIIPEYEIDNELEDQEQQNRENEQATAEVKSKSFKDGFSDITSELAELKSLIARKPQDKEENEVNQEEQQQKDVADDNLPETKSKSLKEGIADMKSELSGLKSLITRNKPAHDDEEKYKNMEVEDEKMESVEEIETIAEETTKPETKSKSLKEGFTDIKLELAGLKTLMKRSKPQEKMEGSDVLENEDQEEKGDEQPTKPAKSFKEGIHEIKSELANIRSKIAGKKEEPEEVEEELEEEKQIPAAIAPKTTFRYEDELTDISSPVTTSNRSIDRSRSSIASSTPRESPVEGHKYKDHHLKEQDKLSVHKPPSISGSITRADSREHDDFPVVLALKTTSAKKAPSMSTISLTDSDYRDSHQEHPMSSSSKNIAQTSGSLSSPTAQNHEKNAQLLTSTPLERNAQKSPSSVISGSIADSESLPISSSGHSTPTHRSDIFAHQSPHKKVPSLSDLDEIQSTTTEESETYEDKAQQRRPKKETPKQVVEPIVIDHQYRFHDDNDHSDDDDSAKERVKQREEEQYRQKQYDSRNKSPDFVAIDLGEQDFESITTEASNIYEGQEDEKKLKEDNNLKSQAEGIRVRIENSEVEKDVEEGEVDAEGEKEEMDEENKRQKLIDRRISLMHSKSVVTTQRVIDSDCYFNDGKRNIDFVLAYEANLKSRTKAEVKEENVKRTYRLAFEQKLEEMGVKLEHEGLQHSQDGKTCFVKLHATWEFLLRAADMAKVKMPIQLMDLDLEENSEGPKWAQPTSLFNILASCIRQDANPNNLPDDVCEPEPEYFAAPFELARMKMFLIEDRKAFFTQAQRIRLMWDALQRLEIPRIVRKKKQFKLGSLNYFASADEENMDKDSRPDLPVSLHWLLDKRIYTAVYPLHDSDFSIPKPIKIQDRKQLKHTRNNDPFAHVPQNRWPLRRWLNFYWGKYSAWMHLQPLDEVRSYFGEQVAFYFAWIGFYTNMLVIPAVFGFICLIYGIIQCFFFPPTDEICDDKLNGSLIICRLCPTKACPYSNLHDTCYYQRIQNVFENEMTMPFALFISIWTVTFLELWKRRQYGLAYRWDADNEESHDVVLRPQYLHNVATTRVNPITQEVEPYVSQKEKYRRLGSSISVVLFFLLLVLAFVAGVIAYRTISVSIYARASNSFINKVTPSLFTVITASLINAVIISVLSSFYKRIAWLVTEFEYPRTNEDFDTSYTYKVVLFQFMNYYSNLFYIAILRGPLGNRPDATLQGCQISGCLLEVCIQLMIIMTGMQLMNNLKEILIPLLNNLWRKYKNRSIMQDRDDNPFSRWEKDYLLTPGEEPVAFDDYLEMIIQYGFITMFAAAFPLGATFALINNIIEIRLDAQKWLHDYRRPVPAHVGNIGPWFPVLEIFTKIATLTNAIVIAITSNFIDVVLYTILYSPDHSANGYTDFILSVYNASDFPDEATLFGFGPIINCSSIGNTTASASNYTECLNIGDLQWDEKRKRWIDTCYYRGYYDNKGNNVYKESLQWWQILAARLAFIVVFEHVVVFIQMVIAYLIPDVPEQIKLKREREKYIVRQKIMEHDLGKEKYDRIYGSKSKTPMTEEEIEEEEQRRKYDNDDNDTFSNSHLSRKQRKKDDEIAGESEASKTGNSDIEAGKGVKKKKKSKKSKARNKPPFIVSMFKKMHLFC